MNKKVLKNTKVRTIKTKLNSLEKKIPDVSTLNRKIHHNTSKQNLKEKIEVTENKIPLLA